MNAFVAVFNLLILLLTLFIMRNAVGAGEWRTALWFAGLSGANLTSALFNIGMALN